MVGYQVLMHPESYQRAVDYLGGLRAGETKPGTLLAERLQGVDVSRLPVREFIERLVATKRPQIFAESAVFGDGSDLNQTELSLLGDIGIATPVTIYDNGLHHRPQVHETPFGGTLLFVPGALLRNDTGLTPADWEEVTRNDAINAGAYYALYERRLLPSFIYANGVAAAKNQPALITIPGLGCGQFAGRFRGQLELELRNVLVKFLRKHRRQLPNLQAVYYDPYRTGNNERYEIGHISLMVRPLLKGNEGKPQLCHPREYQEAGDDFGNCQLFSFVAWDHVSWPGNDFYVGSRATDDGVKAAATDSMAVMTGVTGSYNRQTNTYDPPAGYRDWLDMVRQNHLQIVVKGNFALMPEPTPPDQLLA